MQTCGFIPVSREWAREIESALDIFRVTKYEKKNRNERKYWAHSETEMAHNTHDKKNRERNKKNKNTAPWFCWSNHCIKSFRRKLNIDAYDCISSDLRWFSPIWWFGIKFQMHFHVCTSSVQQMAQQRQSRAHTESERASEKKMSTMIIWCHVICWRTTFSTQYFWVGVRYRHWC